MKTVFTLSLSRARGRSLSLSLWLVKRVCTLARIRGARFVHEEYKRKFTTPALCRSLSLSLSLSLTLTSTLATLSVPHSVSQSAWVTIILIIIIIIIIIIIGVTKWPCCKLVRFSLRAISTPVRYLRARLRVEPPIPLNYSLSLTNVLSYSPKASFTAVKSFMEQVQGEEKSSNLSLMKNDILKSSNTCLHFF